MLAAALVVLMIGNGGGEPLDKAFERGARVVLGSESRIELLALDADPPDADSVARASGIDGVVELSWSPDHSKASLHCYLSGEHRWVDREITFGASDPISALELSERGRLLGFAVATMFADDLVEPAMAQRAVPAADGELPRPTQPAPSTAPATRAVEFAGVMSSGASGTAAGLGALAGLRASISGPLWARIFLGGRTGTIATAQASTRTAYFGGGVAVAALPPESRFSIGVRADAFASYFEATHFSDDDPAPDRRSRWLPGADLLVESGVRLLGSAGLSASVGAELVSGSTEIYTHGRSVAVVRPLRAIGEFGLRIGF